jgi:hypothetical protein
MQDIAVALSQLDEVTRARVLHWAAERFPGAEASIMPGAEASITPPALANAVTRLCPKSDAGKLSDETLSVATLSDFFGPREPKVLTEPATGTPGQSVPGMLKDFIVEFQDIAREWNVACSHPIDAPAAEPVRSVVS